MNQYRCVVVEGLNGIEFNENCLSVMATYPFYSLICIKKGRTQKRYSGNETLKRKVKYVKRNNEVICYPIYLDTLR